MLVRVFLLVSVCIILAYLILLNDLFIGKGCGGPQRVSCPTGYMCWEKTDKQLYGQCIHANLEGFLPILDQLRLLPQ